jgi:hypothetical protein
VSIDSLPRRIQGTLLPPLLLAAFLVLRFWTSLTAAETRIDEGAYLRAFEVTRQGGSPYREHGFLYLPAFAVLGGHAVDWLGAGKVRWGLRAATVAGAAAVVWLSATLLPWTTPWRLAASTAYLAAAPGVSLALRTGNVAPVAGALIVAGLLFWPRAPAASGALLAASLPWKPLGVLALPLLGAHRPAGGGRRHLVAAAVGVATAAAVALCGVDYLRDFLRFGAALESEDFRVSRTVSLHRLLLALGLPVGRLEVAIAITVAALLLARSRAWTRNGFLCFALAACCLSVPALWPHSLLMTLPIQILALRRALGSQGAASADGGARRARRYQLAAVACGVAALQWSDGVGGLDPHPSLALAAALLPAVLAPPLLALYVIAGLEPASGD